MADVDGQPQPRKRSRRQKSESEKRAKQFRRREEGRRKRTFSCTRLYGADEQPASPPLARKRELLLAKAKRLAFPVDAIGKYKEHSVSKLYARDISAAGCRGLAFAHKSGLHIVLNDLLRRHRWQQVAGVLSVLLRAVLAEPCWSPYYSQYFWAAMEVTRQLEGLHRNDWQLKRMFQILYDKQPKGPWEYFKPEAGVVRLELAFYLLSQKQYEEANMVSESFVATPPYRAHSLANLVHGLIHYYKWFDLVEQDVEQEMKSEEMVDLSEGVGENDDFFGAKHSFRAEGLSKEPIIRLDDAFHSEDTSTFEYQTKKTKRLMPSQELEEVVPHVQQEVSWNMYDDTEEENEKSYMRKARVLYNKELDGRLFPFRLPYQYWEKDYKLVAKTVSHNKSSATAIKHLQDSLSLENGSSTALLPLVQLLLAGADIESAFSEIDKSCQKFSDFNSLRIKCLFLESLTPKNKELVAGAYEEFLKKDPSSIYTIERLIEVHEAGNYTTEDLVQQIGLHLDACSGSVRTWKALAFCFQNLKEAIVEHTKEAMSLGSDETAQGNTNYFWQSSMQEWKIREPWWLAKHFEKNTIEELNANGSQWLLFKASSAAHIYGPCMHYVSEAEKNLEELGKYSYLEELQRHKENSFDLLSFFKKLDNTDDSL